MKIYLAILFLLIAHVAAYACPACEKQQPKILRGVVHGAGPSSQWDYVIVWVAVLVVAVSLFYTIKWLIWPGERSSAHIKNVILKNR